MENNLEPDMLFGTPVWDRNIELNEDTRNYLITEYKILSENTEGVPKYEAGGWQSEFIKYKPPLIPTVENELHEAVRGWSFDTIKSGYKNKMPLKLDGYVINVNYGTSYNKKYISPNKALFVATYFLTAPDPDAHVVFYHGYPYITDFMHTLEAEDHTLTYPVVHYEPKVGRCLLYPSWLPVSILPGKTDEKRITIDFYFRSI